MGFQPNRWLLESQADDSTDHAMTTMPARYPVGHSGLAWGDAERLQWRERQIARRKYDQDVLERVEALCGQFDVVQYGATDCGDTTYRLLAVRSRNWDAARPIAVVTGGVHGYETSGVHGALLFLERYATDYAERINLLVVPCVSPWAYERVNRWNADAIDPNRSFREDAGCGESDALLELLAPLRGRVLVHVDLHETTDSDESEFRPAKAARDGEVFEPGHVPDGFYVVDDTLNPQPEFQQAIIDAVAQITHIAPADASGEIIGSPVVAPGVIRYPVRELALCAGITGARFTTTTEVYPDSPRATPEQCNQAQAAAVCAALDYAIAHA
jgi:hypothetical protein